MEVWCLRMNFQYCRGSPAKRNYIHQVKGTRKDGTFWDLRCRRNFHDREVTELQRILDLHQKQCKSVNRPNAWVGCRGITQCSFVRFSMRSFW